MKLDLTKTPFSRYGSFIAVSAKNGKDYYIHSARRLFGEDKVFHIDFSVDGEQVIPHAEFYPDRLEILHGDSKMLFYINGEDSFVIRNDGFDLTLKLMELPSKNGDVPEAYPLAYGSRVNDSHLKIISVNARYCIGIHHYTGNAELEGPFKLNERGEQVDNRSILKIAPGTLCEIDVAPIERHPSLFVLPDVDSDLKSIRTQWETFRERLPEVPEKYMFSALRSWYNLWACTVPASGNYKYPTVQMSMEFMSSVWSWDHCFNAIALSQADLTMGLNQFFVPFEQQASNGALPDYVNPDLEVVWGVTKPPVHGWCFSHLMNQYDIDESVLRKAYDHLDKWTGWWMDYNDTDNDGIPDYPMGCDSGLDNSTVFDLGYYVESPDLSAYLVLQMHSLAEIAVRLGMDDKAAEWRNKADNLYERLISHSWTENGFVAKLSRSHEHDEKPTSIITMLPLVLGSVLDEEKIGKMAEILEEKYLTSFGLATEQYESPYYKDDNYWRGAIWAPTTYLITDGLIRAGRTELAFQIAEKFCDMIAFTAEGDYENFDALTGRGLRACGYTWTSSVNILLLQFLYKCCRN